MQQQIVGQGQRLRLQRLRDVEEKENVKAFKEDRAKVLTGVIATYVGTIEQRKKEVERKAKEHEERKKRQAAAQKEKLADLQASADHFTGKTVSRPRLQYKHPNTEESDDDFDPDGPSKEKTPAFWKGKAAPLEAEANDTSPLRRCLF